MKEKEKEKEQKPNTCRVCGNDKRTTVWVHDPDHALFYCSKCGACACDLCFNIQEKDE